MGTAPIKDVMLSFQATGGIDAPGKQDGKGGMFMDVLNGAVAKNGLAQANQSDPSTVRQASFVSSFLMRETFPLTRSAPNSKA